GVHDIDLDLRHPPGPELVVRGVGGTDDIVGVRPSSRGIQDRHPEGPGGRRRGLAGMGRGPRRRVHRRTRGDHRPDLSRLRWPRDPRSPPWTGGPSSRRRWMLLIEDGSQGELMARAAYPKLLP